MVFQAMVMIFTMPVPQNYWLCLLMEANVQQSAKHSGWKQQITGCHEHKMQICPLGTNRPEKEESDTVLITVHQPNGGHSGPYADMEFQQRRVIIVEQLIQRSFERDIICKYAHVKSSLDVRNKPNTSDDGLAIYSNTVAHNCWLSQVIQSQLRVHSPFCALSITQTFPNKVYKQVPR